MPGIVPNRSGCRARRLAALRLVRGAGGNSVAHVAPWSHSNDVVRPPQKKRRVVEPLVDSMEVFAARAFRPGPSPKRIRDALCDSTLWPSVAALVEGFEDRHVPAERGQGADRRQEVVTLGAPPPITPSRSTGSSTRFLS